LIYSFAELKADSSIFFIFSSIDSILNFATCSSTIVWTSLASTWSLLIKLSDNSNILRRTVSSKVLAASSASFIDMAITASAFLEAVFEESSENFFILA